jgi:LacI family transcriptional regulator
MTNKKPTSAEKNAEGRPISGVELSRKLGLSHATVSFVLNGLGKQKKISPATIKRVQEAAVKYNFAPNLFARSLKTQRSGMVGVILGNLSMDWAETVMVAIQDVFDSTQYVPFVATHRFEVERNRREVLSSLQRRDDGLITLPMPGCEDLYRMLAKSRVPVVFVADELADFTEEISSVMWDPTEAIRAAISHLAEIGRTRIAFLGMNYPGLGTLHRFESFKDALGDLKLPFRPEWVANLPNTLGSLEATGWAMDKFFRDPSDAPNAIFALNDGVALPALEVLEMRGYRVPEDVALIGMGDLPMTRHSAVGISTAPEPIAKMATIAAELLLDLIENRISDPVRKTLPTREFFPRRTTLGQPNGSFSPAVGPSEQEIGTPAKSI